MLLSRILQSKAYAKPVMISLGYTLGDEKCLMAALTIAIFFFAVGWINLVRMNSHD